MRCLALAQGWRDRGQPVALLSAPGLDSLADRWQQEGCRVHSLASKPGSLDDARETESIARELSTTHLAVDGYHFDTDFQHTLVKAGFRVLWIDDEALAAPFSAPWILNQNLHGTESLYPDRHAGTRLLLGPRHSLLRREFRHPEFREDVPKVAQRLLVTLGGSDPQRLSSRILFALKRLADRGERLQVRLVVGRLNPQLDELIDLARELGPAFEILVDVRSMASQMSWADLAIAAAGSTSWELACLGVPMVLVVTAPNQKPVADELVRRDAAVAADGEELLDEAGLADQVGALLHDARRRQELRQQARALVDGEGVERVIAHVLDERLRLRPVQSLDRRQLWTWANDPSVREGAFSQAPIPWEDHCRWFDDRLANPRGTHFIAFDLEDRPVGQVRFDPLGEEASMRKTEISISLDQTARGSGLGTDLLRLACDRLFRTSETETIRALILPDNHASIRAFEKARFVPSGRTRRKGHPALQYTLERSRDLGR